MSRELQEGQRGFALFLTFVFNCYDRQGNGPPKVSVSPSLEPVNMPGYMAKGK